MRPDRKVLALGSAIVAMWAAQATILVGRATTEPATTVTRAAADSDVRVRGVEPPSKERARDRVRPETEAAKKTETAERVEKSTSSGSKRDVFPIDLRVTPSCVEIGDAATVVLETTPKASVALVVAYSDGDARGTYTLGEANSKGSYRYRFVVPPTAPEGKARALVAVRSADGKQAGDETATFTVAGSGGCDR